MNKEEGKWRRIEGRLVGLQWEIRRLRKDHEEVGKEMREKVERAIERRDRSESIRRLDQGFRFLIISLTVVSSMYFGYFLWSRQPIDGLIPAYGLDPGIFRFTVLSVLVPVISWMVVCLIENRKWVVLFKSLSWTFGIVILGRYVLFVLEKAQLFSIPYMEAPFHVLSLSLFFIPGALVSAFKIAPLHHVRDTLTRASLAMATSLLGVLVFHRIRSPTFWDQSIVGIAETAISIVFIVLVVLVITRDHDEDRSTEASGRR